MPGTEAGGGFQIEHRSGPVRRPGLRGRSRHVTGLARSSQVARDQAAAAGRAPTRHRIWRCGVLAAVAWLAIAWFTERWPDVGDVGPAGLLAGCMATIGLALAGASVASIYVDLPRLFRTGPWLVALALLLGLWELATAKLDLLPRPFFATPQSLIEVYVDDWPRLGECVARSLMLLVTGYAIGAVIGLRQRRGDWMVPCHRLLGASGASLHRAAAGDRLAAAGVLRVSIELERRGISDRAGDRISGRRIDLVRRGERQPRVLRRRANSRRAPRLPDSEGRHPGRDAVGLRRALHGSWGIVRGAGRGRDDGRESRAWLVPELGAGLGRLSEHVRGAAGHGVDVQRSDHAAVPPARPAAVLAEGVCCGGSGGRSAWRVGPGDASCRTSSSCMGSHCPCSMRSTSKPDLANSLHFRPKRLRQIHLAPPDRRTGAAALGPHRHGRARRSTGLILRASWCFRTRRCFRGAPCGRTWHSGWKPGGLLRAQRRARR